MVEFVSFYQTYLYVHSCVVRQNVEPLTIPAPDGQPAIFPDKINKLVTEISQLNLLEVSDLSKALKQRLNLPDAPMMAMGAIPAKGAEVSHSRIKAIHFI